MGKLLCEARHQGVSYGGLRYHQQSLCFRALVCRGTSGFSHCPGGVLHHTQHILYVSKKKFHAVRLLISSVINDFFTSWNDALSGASLSALFIAQPIINLIDQDQKTLFGLNDLLTALSASFAFIPAVGAGVSAAARAGLTVLETGLQQAPGVAKAIWPSGTEDTKSIQLANIDTELSKAQSNFTTGIVNALSTVMSDVPAFIAFAQNGDFSSPDEVSLPSDTISLGFALNTYVLSSAMTANSWRVYPHLSTTRAKIESGWGCTFDSNNLCNDDDDVISIFFSDVTNNGYGLAQWQAVPNVPPPTLMKDIITNQWSTLEALFDGAFNCTVAGGYGQAPNFYTNNLVDLSCVSQLLLCACVTPCPVALINGACPLNNCDVCN